MRPAAPVGLAIGIDVGGTHVRAGRIGPGGEILSRAHLPSAREPRAVLADCLSLIEALRTSEVVAVGLGVPGRVDAATGAVLSGGYVDLSSLPFASRVAEVTGLEAIIENDAAMALLAEQAIGAAQGFDNAVMLTIGTGIGGAILENGCLLRGRRTAGQLGHIVLDPEGLPCLCGRRGCLETASSGTALIRHLVAAGWPPQTRAEDILGQPDNPAARAAIEAWAGPLRQAVDSLVATLDPDVVLLGGGLGRAAAAALREVPAAPSWYGAPLRAAQLGDDAGIVGAGLAALRLGKVLGERGRKRVILVNGVPASGKSGVARILADRLGWPLLALDTIKAPFLNELPPGDRSFNRRLGRASLRAMLDLLREAPEGDFVLDAWFGFQPIEMLATGLREAGVVAVAEIWCEAPSEEVGRRYAERVPHRSAGHPGLDYVPELVTLARRATPTGEAPVLRIDTTRPLDTTDAIAWIMTALADAEKARSTTD